MKSKIYLALLASTIGLTFSSCTDLDVDVKSQYTQFPNTERAAEAISADVYAAYRGAVGYNRWMTQTLSSDEAVSLALGTDYYDGGRFRQLHVHDWNADNPILPDLWDGAMTGINLANNVLAIFNDDEGEKAAPMRAMRAFFYFMLMDNFGGAPLITGKVDQIPDRSSRAEICAFIESELLAVRDKLPQEVSAATYGKATRYMADAVLAKLYLNWAVYNTADVADYNPGMVNDKLNQVVEMCDDIIESEKFNLNSHSFLEKFRPDNGPQIKDFIFAMPFDRVTQRGMTFTRYWIHRSAQNQFANLPSSVAGTFRVLPEFLDKFHLEGDQRNDIYIGGKQYYWSNYAPNMDRPFTITTSKKGIDQDYTGADADDIFDWQVEITKEIELRPGGEATLDGGNDQKGRSMGYRSIKFYMDTDVTAADERNQSNDVPIFRYADVLLMKAEAILRGATPTKGATAQSLINEIRAYVGAEQLDHQPTLEELLDERAREFTDEGWRRNDLIRFGKFEDDWGFKYLYPAGKTEKFRRIFPLPTQVLNVNTHWSQNPGY